MTMDKGPPPSIPYQAMQDGGTFMLRCVTTLGDEGNTLHTHRADGHLGARGQAEESWIVSPPNPHRFPLPASWAPGAGRPDVSLPCDLPSRS
jgi:hypothetical protein